MDFQKYSKEHVFFYTGDIPSLIKKHFPKKNIAVADIGCGDGTILIALKNKGYLNNAKKVVGIDLSEDRINKLKEYCKNYSFYARDACKTGLKKNNFDFIINSQVIEHVKDEKELLKELHSLLKKNGKLYISSVIKKKHGFYFYKNNGRIVIDPTHVREYSSKEQFLDILRQNRLNIIDVKVSNISFPIIDLFIRGLSRLSKQGDANGVFIKYPFLKLLRAIKLPIIGYFNIEVIAQK